MMFSKIVSFRLLGLLALVVMLGSCKENEPKPANEEEVITTLTLKFTAGAKTETFIFRDIDGSGGNPPSKFDAISLGLGTTYDLEITLTNESVSPTEDITAEVEEESHDHQFFFTGTAITNNLLTHSYNDKDHNNLPLGLKNKITTVKAGAGKFTVVLKHQPSLKTATSTINTGETDIEVSFDLNVIDLR